MSSFSSKRTESGNSQPEIPTITVNKEMVDLVGSEEQQRRSLSSRGSNNSSSSSNRRRPLSGAGYEFIDDNNKENQHLTTGYGSNKREKLSYRTGRLYMNVLFLIFMCVF